MGLDDAHRRAPRRLRWPLLVLVALCSTLVGACSSDPASPPQPKVADAYAAIITWFVARPATSATLAEGERPIVYVEPRGEGLSFGVEMQASVISATESEADVRFIDDRVEAFDEDDHIREGAILLALGPASPVGGRVEIECAEVVSATMEVLRTFELRAHDGEWTITGEPHPG